LVEERVCFSVKRAGLLSDAASSGTKTGVDEEKAANHAGLSDNILDWCLKDEHHDDEEEK
jgi:hypothetical protein